ENISTTGIANQPGHGRIAVKPVRSPAATSKLVRQRSVLSVLLPTGGCPPTFGGTSKIQVASHLKLSGSGSKQVPPRGWRNLPFRSPLAEPPWPLFFNCFLNKPCYDP